MSQYTAAYKTDLKVLVEKIVAIGRLADQLGESILADRADQLLTRVAQDDLPVSRTAQFTAAPTPQPMQPMQGMQPMHGTSPNGADVNRNGYIIQLGKQLELLTKALSQLSAQSNQRQQQTQEQIQQIQQTLGLQINHNNQNSDVLSTQAQGNITLEAPNANSLNMDFTDN